MTPPSIAARHDPPRQPLSLSPMPNDENNHPDLLSAPTTATALSHHPPHMDLVVDHPQPLPSTPGVPLSDYKALVAERDALRRKLSAVEAERTQLLDNDTSLRKSLEDATDRLRILETDHAHLQNKLVEKGRALNQATESLRLSALHSEQLDSLRHKADKADDLDARLKHHSQRLEEMGTIRQTNKDLHAEISAFRETELTITKHVEYLESQLGRTNQRAKQLSNDVESLSKDLQDKEARYCDLHEENDILKSKLEHVTEQLEAAILQTSMSKAPTTTATYSAAPSVDVVPKTAGHTSTDDGTPAAESPGMTTADLTAADDAEAQEAQEETEGQGQFDAKAKMHVSDLLLDAIGIRVGWEDVVECMRGVMDAMQDMEQGAEMEQQGAEASVEQIEQIGQLGSEDRKVERFRASAESMRRLRSNASSFARLRASEQSLRSYEAVRTETTASDGVSRLSFVPEFGVLDETLKAKGTDSGDEFDFAANQCNVQEVRLLGGDEEGTAEESAGEDGYEEECSYDGEETEESLGMIRPSVRMLRRKAKAKLGGKEVKSSSSGAGAPSAPMIGAMIDESMQSGEKEKKKMSVSLTIHGMRSGSTSRSDTTSVIARQTRHDLRELQRAMEMMRVERQSSASVTALAHKLDAARVEMELMRKKMVETESESANLRREMNGMLKEMDDVTLDRQTSEDVGREVVEEKERLLQHLEESLRRKEELVCELREKYEASREQVEVAQRNEQTLRDKLEAATMVERAHEVEIARLTTQVEELENMERLMNCVMAKTEEQLHTMADMSQRDKQLVEEMRDEARRAARRQASVLEDMKASAAAAVLAREAASQSQSQSQSPTETQEPPAPQLRMPPRQSSKFQEFFRKLLHRESRASAPAESGRTA